MSRRRSRSRRAAIAVVFLLVIIAVAAAAGGRKGASSLPTGRWGKLIACLEGHPLFAVNDAYSTNANPPNAQTKAVNIWQNLKGVSLAYVGDNSRGADDFTGSDAANVSLADGQIHYGFTPRADNSDKYAITSCVTGAYGS